MSYLMNMLSDPYELVMFLFRIPIVLIALSVHEASHGYAAYKCGDPTARNLGRLTLNPVRHLDLLGTICMLLFGIGWAKPVPVNTRYFKNPRNVGVIENADGVGEVGNVKCGDIMKMYLKIENDIITDVKFNTSVSYKIFKELEEPLPLPPVIVNFFFGGFFTFHKVC